jgi:transcription initiation factor TFIIIB Brf1 subunit/transcription initiation factor TFIIB
MHKSLPSFFLPSLFIHLTGGIVLTVVVSIPKLKRLSSCEDCSSDLIESSGYLVCSRCGLVHDRILTQPRKVMGINQQILNVIYTSRTEDVALSPRLTRLNGPSNNLYTFYENNETVQKICDDLHLPEVAKLRVVQIFKKLSLEEEKYRELFERDYISNILAFISIYIATKEHKIILSFKTIYETFRKNGKNVSKYNINRAIKILSISQRFTVEDYLAKFEPEFIKAFPGIEPKTKQILELAKLKRNFQGSDPRVFASACLYIVYYRCNGDRRRGMVTKIIELNGSKSIGGIRLLFEKILAFLDLQEESS